MVILRLCRADGHTAALPRGWSHSDSYCWPLANLACATAALPPDVRRGYASPETNYKKYGLCPWYGLWPTQARAKPEPGAQPILLFEDNGGAEPRLTSGGVAAPSLAEPAAESHRVWQSRRRSRTEFGRAGGGAAPSLVEPARSRTSLGKLTQPHSVWESWRSRTDSGKSVQTKPFKKLQSV
jgi:hypothetical protein